LPRSIGYHRCERYDRKHNHADHVVHLVGISGDPATGSETPLKLEHFALSATGCAGFLEKLDAKGIAYKRGELADFNLIQINIWDPDGNHIHIDFPADE